MTDFILLMHNDTKAPVDPAAWPDYFAMLNAHNAFLGGSAIGTGEAFRRQGKPGPVATHIGGFIRIRAQDLPAARELLAGNPVFEAGGTVEIRALSKDEG